MSAATDMFSEIIRKKAAEIELLLTGSTALAAENAALRAERDEWRQAAGVEANLRREAHAENERLLAALATLAAAEKHYRSEHDLRGDGSREAGRAWDLMRRAGDAARAILNPSS